MSKITVLPPQVANKIAAGEVVERPASVVKELVENAVDAGATDIQIHLEQAGKERIQVIDNGCGMDAQDAELAFERHATSKIRTAADLDEIRTMGFRGEALPSIASVARVELKTRTPDSPVGTLLRLENGKVVFRSEVVMNPGTIITVKQLFYNTPARRNFLRSDNAEMNQILKVVKRFFLAHPEIRFLVSHNGETLFDLPTANLDDRITQVFGKKFYEGLVFVKERLNDIELEGYVSRPDHTRGNTENQFIFLNQRTIINRNLAHAVFQAFGNLIERGRYPQFVLFLTIPPQLVDVNVHPTKMEVRFANERVIYHLFLSAVRRAVQQEDVVPAFELQSDDPQKKEIRRHFLTLRSGGFARRRPISSAQPLPANQPQLSLTFKEESSDKPEDSSPEIPLSASAASTDQPALWQVHNRYILSQVKSGLVIIDQHVAHERVLFEKVLAYLDKNQAVPSQQLLFPQTLELALEDYLVYTEIKEWLYKVGFTINELSGRTLLIEAIPADVKIGYEGKVLLEMIDHYREHEGSKMPPHERIAAAYACKNAVKSGDKLSLDAMTALVDQLFACKEPFFCPHGRPVIVNLNLEELDRKFKRIK